MGTCTYLLLFRSEQLVAAATIRERRLFRSALAPVRLLFESGVYSRAASIRSYTVTILRLYKFMHIPLDNYGSYHSETSVR